MADIIRIARQPILDRKEHIYAYELLFRDMFQSDAQSAESFIIDNQLATARVVVNALNQFGISNLVGDKFVFLNADASFILSDSILNIPAKHFIIEILEHVTVTKELLERLTYLKSMGYRFALDDATFDEAFFENFEPLFELVDIVKLDIVLIKPDAFERIRPVTARYGFELLAEKVETKDDFETYKALGCRYFQGYFFAKPEIKEQATLDTRSSTIVRLITLLDRDMPTQSIVSEFEMEPEISLQLIRYLNSAAIALRSTIKSIQHALVLLGKTPLRNWLLLISFSGEDSDYEHAPLFELALTRSLMMGKLAQTKSNDKNFISQASFVGLLSLVDNIFQIPLEEVTRQLNVDREISAALLNREGFFGKTLELVIAMEVEADESITTLCEDLKISADQLQEITISAYMKTIEQHDHLKQQPLP